MSTIRTRTIAITPSLDKWLRWAATATDSTPEAIVDQIVTNVLLAEYPKIKDIQDAHDVASAKLWNEAADKLRGRLP